LPALLWLWFWLHEDRKSPEPKRKILAAFVCGMFSVALVLPIEKFFYGFFGNVITLVTLLSWATTEEILKFGAGFFSTLRKNIDNDEPIDAFIYLVSAALGFSALENSLFLLKALNSENLTQSIISGNMRFIGATLLHVASSATIGIFAGLGFFLDKESKKIHLFTGILVAICLHTIFNWFIIKAGENLFFVFGGVWLSIICIIFMIEKVKTLKI